MRPLNQKKVLTSPVDLLSTGLGVGLSPVMPGTLGTVVCIPLLPVFKSSGFIWETACVLLLGLVGFWACYQTMSSHQVDDHPSIVIDEILGFAIAMLWVPLTIFNVLLGFALFRLFDISKIGGIRKLETNLTGAPGVMLDDVLAGAYVFIIMHLLQFF